MQCLDEVVPEFVVYFTHHIVKLMFFCHISIACLASCHVISCELSKVAVASLLTVSSHLLFQPSVKDKA